MEVVFIIQSSELRTLLTCIFDGSGQGISPAEGYSWLQEEERKETHKKPDNLWSGGRDKSATVSLLGLV